MRDIAELEGLEARIRKLEKRKPFSTIFEWCVVGCLVGLLALVIIRTDDLQRADNRIVAQLGAELKSASETVHRLWEIWGK